MSLCDKFYYYSLMIRTTLKTLFIWLLLLWQSCPASCPETLPDQMYNALKDKIPWVDINAQGTFSNSCKLTVRYYPASTPIYSLVKQTVVTLLPPWCILRQAGRVVPVEGYAELVGVYFQCQRVTLG